MEKLSTARLENFLACLLYERGLAQNTIEAYRRDLAQYLRYVGEGPVDSAKVEGFLASLAERGLSAATAARKLSAVKGYHKFLCEEEGVEHNPAAKVRRPKVPSLLPKALPVDEVLAILSAPRTNTARGRRDRALLEFLYSTACRVQEAVGLDLGHLDLSAGSARVLGKGSQPRAVLMGAEARRTMRCWLKDRAVLAQERTEAVFLNLRGGRMDRMDAWRLVKVAAKQAGLSPDRVSPHVLRHSAATHMVEGGADLRAVQELLGHVNLSTTEAYVRIFPQVLHEIYVTSHPRSGAF